MKIKAMTIGVFLILFIFAGSPAQAGFNLSGSFYNEFALRGYEQEGDLGWKFGAKNALRLNFKNLDYPQFKLEGSFDLLLLSGDDADVYAATNPGAEDDSLLVHDFRLLPLLDVRKLYVSYYADRYTLTLGRQIVNYGVGHIFSPVDSFSSVELQDVGLSRRGSDIARIQVPLGALSGFEAVTTLEGEDNVGAVKIFGNVWDYDMSLTGIYKNAQKEALLGFAFKGDLFDTGIRGEFVEHYGTDSGRRYFESMLGADWSFLDGKVLLLAEYYHNGDPVDPDTLTSGELAKLDRIFLGKNYFFSQATYIFDEIRNLSLNILCNPAEKSWAGILQFAYNTSQNTDWLFYTRYYRGDLNGADSGKNGSMTEIGARVEVKF